MDEDTSIYVFEKTKEGVLRHGVVDWTEDLSVISHVKNWIHSGYSLYVYLGNPDSILEIPKVTGLIKEHCESYNCSVKYWGIEEVSTDEYEWEFQIDSRSSSKLVRLEDLKKELDSLLAIVKICEKYEYTSLQSSTSFYPEGDAHGLEQIQLFVLDDNELILLAASATHGNIENDNPHPSSSERRPSSIEFFDPITIPHDQM